MAKRIMMTCGMAAKLLGFTADYIRRMCGTGQIKAEKLGNIWTFPKSEIKGLKRQRKKQGDDKNGSSDE